MKIFISIFLLSFTLLIYGAGTDSHMHDHKQGEEDNQGNHHVFTFGLAGDLENADRTIEVVMTDNKYDLASLNVKAGETIYFKIKNEGQQIHEFTLATTDMHNQHQAEMLNHISSGHMTMTDKGHSGAHDHDNSLLLNPGEESELIWMFAATDYLEFACNVPGHYQSGMVGKISVE